MEVLITLADFKCVSGAFQQPGRKKKRAGGGGEQGIWGWGGGKGGGFSNKVDRGREGEGRAGDGPFEYVRGNYKYLKGTNLTVVA